MELFITTHTGRSYRLCRSEPSSGTAHQALEPYHLMPTSSLPTELWLTIVQDPSLSQVDHLAIALINSHFNAFVTPILYSTMRISLLELPHKKMTPRHQKNQNKTKSFYKTILHFTTSKFHLAPSRIARLFERLEENEQLRSYIKSFQLDNGSELGILAVIGQSEEFQSMVRAILCILASCPRLEELEMIRLHLDISDLYQFLVRPGISLSLKLVASIISGEPKLGDSVYRVGNLVCSGMNIRAFYPVLLGNTLTRLSITTSTDGCLGDVRTKLPANMKPSLSALRELHIKTLTNDILLFLLLAPSVMELRIEDIARAFTFPTSWSDMLPCLESFDGPSQLIPHLVHRRPVTSLSSWHRDSINWTPFYDMGPNFGSSVPVRTVRWSRSFHLSIFLGYLWKYNPRVEELCFEDTFHYLTKVRRHSYKLWLFHALCGQSEMFLHRSK
jgi:hypothetical protein